MEVIEPGQSAAGTRLISIPKPGILSMGNFTSITIKISGKGGKKTYRGISKKEIQTGQKF
jgi:hypothetical protein